MMGEIRYILIYQFTEYPAIVGFYQDGSHSHGNIGLQQRIDIAEVMAAGDLTNEATYKVTLYEKLDSCGGFVLTQEWINPIFTKA